MPADCEKTITGGRTCGVAAVGRCHACGDAYCPTHQRRDLTSIGTVLRAYTDWCITCQQAQEAPRRATADSATAARVAELKAATARLPELIAEFKRLPFSGQPREWKETHQKAPRLFSKKVRWDVVPHADEPAVPLGQLWWTYYLNRTHPDISESQQRHQFDTGLTRSAEFVVMNVEPAHSPYGYHDYRLQSGQEVEIVRLLDRLLERY